MKAKLRWCPPPSWQRFVTVDAHAAGEPFRVVVDGVPEIPGATILERRRWARKNLDGLRRQLMWEPRGHADMYGCFLTPPVSPEADLGVLFMHNEGFSTMCGHGIIALTTVVLECGLLPRADRQDGEVTVRIDSPAGLVTASADVRGGRVGTVRFRNVASWAELDQEVEVPGIGRLRYDLAFGGAFYAYVRAADAGVGLGPESFRELIARGTAIKRAVVASREVVHPFEEDLGFLYGVIFTGPAAEAGVHSCNVCVFADGEVDRSPTGTGVSGRAAIHHARGELVVGETILVESIVGSRFSVRVVEETVFGPHPAIVPEVAGRAHLLGRNELVVDPADPLREGFILR